MPALAALAPLTGLLGAGSSVSSTMDPRRLTLDTVRKGTARVYNGKNLFGAATQQGGISSLAPGEGLSDIPPPKPDGLATGIDAASSVLGAVNAAGALGGATGVLGTVGKIAGPLGLGLGLVSLANQINNETYSVANPDASYDKDTGRLALGDFSAGFTAEKGLLTNTGSLSYKDLTGKVYTVGRTNGRTGNTPQHQYKYLQQQGASLPDFDTFLNSLRTFQSAVKEN